jgi:hypothetical protein
MNGKKIAWDKRGFETRRVSSPQVCFFPFIFKFEYTNGYLKVLLVCLRVETSGAVGKGDGVEIKRAPGLFIFLYHYYYTKECLKINYATNGVDRERTELTGAAGARDRRTIDDERRVWYFIYLLVYTLLTA